MKRNCSGLAEVQLKHPRNGPLPFCIPLGSGGSAAYLPEGATVTVPIGFDAEEVFVLLTVVREALR